MEKEKLKEIVENTISGEWGTEEKKDENDIFVIRTADFLNDGRINYNNVIKRNIAKRKIEEKSLKIGDIIVEKSGGTDKNPVGRVVLFERENYKFLANNFTQVLRIKKEYYYKFIFYQLLYKYKNGSTLQMFNKTTGIQNLQMKLYLNQELNVCDKKDQIKISNLLDKVQEIIDFRKNQIQELDELIKSQFVEMFGNINNKEKIKLLNNYFSRGKSPNYVDNSKIGVINQACIYWDYFKMENIKYQDELRINNSIEKMIRKNDILITSTGTGTLGRCNVYRGEDNKYIADGHVSILRLKEKIINPTYFKYYFMQDKVQKQLYSECVNGSTNQIELSKDKFLNFDVSVPDIEEQNKFADFVKQIDKQKFEIQKSLNEMKKLQESLMNKYFG